MIFGPVSSVVEERERERERKGERGLAHTTGAEESCSSEQNERLSENLPIKKKVCDLEQTKGDGAAEAASCDPRVRLKKLEIRLQRVQAEKLPANVSPKQHAHVAPETDCHFEVHVDDKLLAHRAQTLAPLESRRRSTKSVNRMGFTCDQCGKTWPIASRLKTHYNTHIRPHVCELFRSSHHRHVKICRYEEESCSSEQNERLSENLPIKKKVCDLEQTKGDGAAEAASCDPRVRVKKLEASESPG
ncbi:hypothetical protein WMY93_009869 [Mugilogobius chulae]|uniref:C2H2-type domain-containing protein n=1 Tax=Mugilogobius chulae TaxID=88201 RepID=A0AAW0P5U4_9GOBI